MYFLEGPPPQKGFWRDKNGTVRVNETIMLWKRQAGFLRTETCITLSLRKWEKETVETRDKGPWPRGRRQH